MKRSQSHNKIKVMVISPYPIEAASYRLRVEQYFPFLAAQGICCKTRPFISSGFYRILYARRRYSEKVFYFIAATMNRLIDIIRAVNYDIVFVHREAFPFGAPFFEMVFSRILGKPMIFDFDDAIFIKNSSEPNTYLERFKNPDKVPAIIRMSSRVIAGNSYLASYAANFNARVSVIPTVIDTSVYTPPLTAGRKDAVTIGWIGSYTTKKFLWPMEAVFKTLSEKFPKLVFKIVGANLESPLKNVVDVKWSLENEVSILKDFDIGIMPMPDNDWTRGKCGFKAILYMAMGIPQVSSPVGVNKEIIKDGHNGFLASGDDEWIRKLSALIEDVDMRKAMGNAARETAEARYSTKIYEKALADIIKDVYLKKRG